MSSSCGFFQRQDAKPQTWKELRIHGISPHISILLAFNDANSGEFRDARRTTEIRHFTLFLSLRLGVFALKPAPLHSKNGRLISKAHGRVPSVVKSRNSFGRSTKLAECECGSVAGIHERIVAIDATAGSHQRRQVLKGPQRRPIQVHIDVSHRDGSR